jgi:hypothetical protein
MPRSVSYAGRSSGCVRQRSSPPASSPKLPAASSESRGCAVEFALPIPVSAAVKQPLAVRVLDAVRSAGRTSGPTRVSVHAPA